jgi:hypothetical protein
VIEKVSRGEWIRTTGLLGPEPDGHTTRPRLISCS